MIYVVGAMIFGLGFIAGIAMAGYVVISGGKDDSDDGV